MMRSLDVSLSHYPWLAGVALFFAGSAAYGNEDGKVGPVRIPSRM